jgi:hypothetical protein
VLTGNVRSKGKGGESAPRLSEGCSHEETITSDCGEHKSQREGL